MPSDIYAYFYVFTVKSSVSVIGML